MSLLRRASRAMADRRVAFDEAERLLDVARRRSAPPEVVDGDLLSEIAEMRDDRVEVIRTEQRHARLLRWMAWDIAPPPELDPLDPEEDR